MGQDDVHDRCTRLDKGGTDAVLGEVASDISPIRVTLRPFARTYSELSIIGMLRKKLSRDFMTALSQHVLQRLTPCLSK